ncbi:GNAT family N-acetyltransferase [Aggregatilinea lenta]|uniref:GNAT family N-acetyltransferase n=1 Tax=Aggregatilinea lenta TaxID=913108 RepID=UPI000E5BFFE5|nr:GNAT family N-acetyltransferase [Aggregatilinea lenta]
MSTGPTTIIRGIQSDDWEAFLPLWRNEAALLNTLESPHLSEEAIRERFNNAPATTHTLIAEVGLASGRRQPVGVAWIERLHTRRRHGAKLRLLMLPTYRDSMLENALLEGVLHHVDQWTTLSRLEAFVFVDDAAELALFERHGFAIEAHMRQFALRGGVMADAYLLARLRPATDAPAADAAPDEEGHS